MYIVTGGGSTIGDLRRGNNARGFFLGFAVWYATCSVAYVSVSYGFETVGFFPFVHK